MNDSKPVGEQTPSNPGQTLADDILLRIAKRYEKCSVNIYPDMPHLTPVVAVLRCAQEEGFVLTNRVAAAPAVVAGMPHAATVKLLIKDSFLLARGHFVNGEFCVDQVVADKRSVEELLAAAPPPVPQAQSEESQLNQRSVRHDN